MTTSRAVARWFWWIIAALVAVRVVSLVAVLLSGQELPHSILGGDARRYGEIVTAQGTPYADFEVEYPPVALALIHLTYAPDHLAQLIRLGISQLAIDLGCAALLGWAFGRRAALAYLVLGLPFLFFPYIWLRIDMLSVLLAVLGVALVHKGRWRTGAAVLAVAVFAKLWPVALAPLFVVERRWKALWAWASPASPAPSPGWPGRDRRADPGVLFRGAWAGRSRASPGSCCTSATPVGRTSSRGRGAPAPCRRGADRCCRSSASASSPCPGGGPTAGGGRAPASSPCTPSPPTPACSPCSSSPPSSRRSTCSGCCPSRRCWRRPAIASPAR
ncbi:MAG: hypothetical protein R2726_16060 [Acidimicrobiales bacterium]